MGHIKEPKGIDFIINSGHLSKDQEESLSKYIKEYKLKAKSKKPAKRKRTSKEREII